MNTASSWKLAFIGEPGAGKTTCIGALSDFPVVSTDVECTDELARIKKTTTVAMDYGEMDLDDQGRLLLYGLPGQVRFNFMMDVVRENLIGIVLLVDGQSRAPVLGLTDTLEAHSAALRSHPVVVAINKTSSDDSVLRRQVQAVLRKYELIAPVLNVDARRRDELARIFDLLFLCGEHG
jgi:signal recognition particle receptor subunit beta